MSSNLHSSDRKISHVKGDLATHPLYSSFIFEHRKLMLSVSTLREQKRRARTQITLRILEVNVSIKWGRR